MIWPTYKLVGRVSSQSMCGSEVIWLDTIWAHIYIYIYTLCSLKKCIQETVFGFVCEHNYSIREHRRDNEQNVKVGKSTTEAESNRRHGLGIIH